MVSVVSSYHDLVRKDVFAVVPSRAGHILDVGGGIGATSAALKAAGRATRITLVDQITEARADGVDHAFAGDLEDPSLLEAAIRQNGPFDTILCLDVLEHLKDPWTTLRHLEAGLTPGGSIVISLPNVNSIDLIGPLVIRGLFDLQDSGIMDRTHLRWFTKQTMIKMANDAGLVVDHIEPRIHRRIEKYINIATAGMFERFFALQYVFRARRLSDSE